MWETCIDLQDCAKLSLAIRAGLAGANEEEILRWIQNTLPPDLGRKTLDCLDKHIKDQLQRQNSGFLKKKLDILQSDFFLKYLNRIFLPLIISVSKMVFFVLYLPLTATCMILSWWCFTCNFGLKNSFLVFNLHFFFHFA